MHWDSVKTLTYKLSVPFDQHLLPEIEACLNDELIPIFLKILYDRYGSNHISVRFEVAGSLRTGTHLYCSDIDLLFCITGENISFFYNYELRAIFFESINDWCHGKRQNVNIKAFIQTPVVARLIYNLENNSYRNIDIVLTLKTIISTELNIKYMILEGCPLKQIENTYTNADQIFDRCHDNFKFFRDICILMKYFVKQTWNNSYPDNILPSSVLETALVCVTQETKIWNDKNTTPITIMMAALSMIKEKWMTNKSIYPITAIYLDLFKSFRENNLQLQTAFTNWLLNCTNNSSVMMEFFEIELKNHHISHNTSIIKTKLVIQ